MNPEQNQPTPSNPPTPAPVPPQPGPPIPQAPQPQSAPTPAPQPAPPQPTPIPPAQPAVQPVYPSQPWQTPSVGQPQDRSGGKRKLILLIIGGLLALGLLGFLAFKLLGGSPEVATGTKFIEAVQDKDYKTISETVDPAVKDIAEKASKKQGGPTQQEFYKDFLESSGITQAIGKEKPQKESLTVSEGGGRKHAVVIYKLGASKVSILEIYEKDRPYVLSATAGSQKITNDQFKTRYDYYKSVLDLVNSSL